MILLDVILRNQLIVSGMKSRLKGLKFYSFLSFRMQLKTKITEKKWQIMITFSRGKFVDLRVFRWWDADFKIYIRSKEINCAIVHMTFLRKKSHSKIALFVKKSQNYKKRKLNQKCAIFVKNLKMCAKKKFLHAWQNLLKET